MSQTVALGLSGGIDSAIAALMLKDAGYQVIGITMSIYDAQSGITEAAGKGCFGPNETTAIEAASRVAHAIRIPHQVIDLRVEFSSYVLDYYRQAFLSGLTPNPCAMCNATIKFGLLPQKARDMGLKFDLFATGHYVQKAFQDGRWQLFRGQDPSKDQSYFLALLTQNQVANTLFPLGELSKKEVREMAKERGLDFLIHKRESQDFIQSGDHSALFDGELIQPGDMVDSSGKVLARHRGLIHYTIGQRKGLGISGQSEPVFVTSINAGQNTITIGGASELYRKELFCINPNWLSISREYIPIRAQAKIRQQHQPADCTLEPLDGGDIRVVFDEPQLSVTPGQIVAFYEDKLLLGGGIIRL